MGSLVERIERLTARRVAAQPSVEAENRRRSPAFGGLPMTLAAYSNASTLGRRRESPILETPTIAQDGWQLVSAEARHAAAPRTFEIPDLQARQGLAPGDAAKLLFDIETREAGRVVHRGVDRMWVIVRRRVLGGYLGVVDNDPGIADGLALRRGVDVYFAAEHVAEIQTPPLDYVLSTYGDDFFHR